MNLLLYSYSHGSGHHHTISPQNSPSPPQIILLLLNLVSYIYHVGHANTRLSCSPLSILETLHLVCKWTLILSFFLYLLSYDYMV